MTIAAITMHPLEMARRLATVNQPFTGEDLDELLAQVSVEKALAQALGPSDDLDVEAVHNVPTALSTV